MSRESASLLLALVFAAIVAALHALGPRLRAVPGIEAASGTSLSGGLAAAYVFVHVLPELARGNPQVAEKLQDDLGDAAATEVGVFLVALLGFFVFFVLQWAAEQPRGDGREPSPAVFAAHVAGFSVYSALIVYLVPLRLQTSPALAAVFCGILALHLVSSDRLLRNQFPQRLGEHPHARLGAERWGDRWLGARTPGARHDPHADPARRVPRRSSTSSTCSTRSSQRGTRSGSPDLNSETRD